LIYSFHPEAEKELNEAIEYYNKCKNGLGFEFTEEVYLAIQEIISFPKAWTNMSANTRRCLLKRFPYGIIYNIDKAQLFIIAVMQLNKKPDYWTKRT
jgi:mRNA-degrading endonuclease RelE of RelBE toxin-antitoxin system